MSFNVYHNTCYTPELRSWKVYRKFYLTVQIEVKLIYSKVNVISQSSNPISINTVIVSLCKIRLALTQREDATTEIMSWVMSVCFLTPREVFKSSRTPLCLHLWSLAYHRKWLIRGVSSICVTLNCVNLIRIPWSASSYRKAVKCDLYIISNKGYLPLLTKASV